MKGRERGEIERDERDASIQGTDWKRFYNADMNQNTSSIYNSESVAFLFPVLSLHSAKDFSPPVVEPYYIYIYTLFTMPKSKRSKVTTLSKTPLRSTKASKSALVTDLQAEIDKYDYVWLFSVGDMRNEGLKEVRGQWRGTGRFYFGKGKVMAKALGLTPETEHADQLSQLAKVCFCISASSRDVSLIISD